MLKKEISKSDAVMAFSFDESLNEITQICDMDVIVCYWSEKAKSEIKIFRSSPSQRCSWEKVFCKFAAYFQNTSGGLLPDIGD